MTAQHTSLKTDSSLPWGGQPDRKSFSRKGKVESRLWPPSLGPWFWASKPSPGSDGLDQEG